jgi:hypothetical protein
MDLGVNTVICLEKGTAFLNTDHLAERAKFSWKWGSEGK